MIENNNILQQTSELLSDKTDLYRLLVEGVHDYAIFLLSPTGHVQTWNLGAQKIKGYKAEEIIGHHFSEFYPEETRASGFPDLELRLATKHGRFEDEGWRVKKDGSVFGLMLLSPLYLVQKEISCLVSLKSQET
ncbi:hypothetical protein GCM10028895_47100 [Pontibacter rugosus]